VLPAHVDTHQTRDDKPLPRRQRIEFRVPSHTRWAKPRIERTGARRVIVEAMIRQTWHAACVALPQGENKKERPSMLRLTLIAAILALIVISSPIFAPAKLDLSAAIPVYHH
jgi:hypothetical protein